MDIESEVMLDLAEPRLHPEIERTLYRLIQESLTNVVKHAAAGRASLRLVEAAGLLKLSVADDGTGFDPAQISAGFGLVGMQERVALVGGKVSVESTPGAGTTVRAEVPARHGDGEAPEVGGPAHPSAGSEQLAG